MSDFRWLLDALKLPDKVYGGLFLGALLLLLLDRYGIINLADFHALARPAAIVAAVVFGSLFAAALALIGRAVGGWRRRTLVSKRQQSRLKEREAARAVYEARVLARLDHLSREQVRVVADALRQNSPSFTMAVSSPEVAQLKALGMVGSPGGVYFQDRCPFYFNDFVWAHLLKRRDEFIARDDREEEAARAKRSR